MSSIELRSSNYAANVLALLNKNPVKYLLTNVIVPPKEQKCSDNLLCIICNTEN